jgi:hypothetical protein
MNQGEAFTFSDGTVVQILPLSLNGMERLTKAGAWEAANSEDLATKFGAMRHIAHEVLRRSVKDITVEQAGDLVDLASFGAFLQVVARVNGMVSVAKGEA